MTSHNEEEYFARETVEKLRKLHHDLVKKIGEEGLEQAKEKFANRCPNCGLEMTKLPSYQGVTLLRCFHCGGAFVPPEAAEVLHKRSQAKEHAIVDAIINWIRPEPAHGK